MSRGIEYRQSMGQSILVAQANRIDELSNHLKAALKLLEFYRSVDWYHDGTATEKPETCLGCRQQQVEIEYAKAISKGQDTSDVSTDGEGT